MPSWHHTRRTQLTGCGILINKEEVTIEASLTNILELALQQGIWAALYIYLFFRMLSENKEREDKYQTIIGRLSGNIEQGIEDILDQRCSEHDLRNKTKRRPGPGSASFCGIGIIRRPPADSRRKCLQEW